MSVTVNPPRTPVTKGSNGIATATMPNVCKMPGPPAPFVPTPLPNIGNSSASPKGYSKNVKIAGQVVAIKGASFGSQGDIASKATGGGVVSANTHGRTTFVGPGSMNVKIEGKNVQLLGDPMFNNCDAGGRTPNAATMVGVLQESGLLSLAGDEVCALCGKQHDEAGQVGETVDTNAAMSTMRGTVADVVAKAKAERDLRIAPERTRLEMKAQSDYLARKTKLEASLAAARAHGRLDAVAKIEQSLANLRPQTPQLSARDVALATMLGVVRCHDGQTFTATSSIQYKEIADALPRGWHVLAGQHSLLDVPAPKWADRKTDYQKFVSNEAAFAKAWEKLVHLAGTEGDEPYYFPGRCAAPQAVLLALEHGAIPAGLTEWWYKAGDPEAKVKVMVRDGFTAPPRLGAFGGETAVPPCGTCQVLLPMLLCPDERTPPCEHHAPTAGVCRCT
jgi:uncharacterized Zn-binding protein involved in type VI secretion